ncbi:nitrate ABC transporter substrate-binding protein [Elioraea sp. Yellowstone]|jgi:ABC-type nitrate/sulfonate/bicarbonate transport system substrate-binding protein|uniref:ABC transporter substrate-binding protein n=1 Tax=Elioraea sp. Yellowstone TaxID=2592070 RepID=UPI00114FA4C8|nr:ABC transporter substrate-binding protein [Elioraea sp. Yellowstone]TQF77407.1 nitrate ABC transporter substrate-binding protein [Elioraea sp. Yellowstone]
MIRRMLLVAAAAAFAAGQAPPAAAQAPVTIKVSYQPSLYWAVPFFIAAEKGWWREMGLAPEFSTFAAGAPQVAALAARAWEAGGTGSAPAVLGAQRFGLLTIGITNDESRGNAVVARRADVERIRANPQVLKGQQILLTTNSTGEYAVLACLKSWGLDRRDVTLVNLGQAQIISAFTAGNGLLAGVWAPNTYTLQERAQGVVICDGKEAGATVPGAIVARADWVREHPDRAAAFLAVYLRSIAWQRANRDETIALMRRFYVQGGVTLDDRYLAAEIDTRPTFTLEEQLRLFSRAEGPSTVDRWLTDLGAYLVSTGTLQQAPDPTTFATDEVLKRIAADPRLRAFANNE